MTIQYSVVIACWKLLIKKCIHKDPSCVGVFDFKNN